LASFARRRLRLAFERTSVRAFLTIFVIALAFVRRVNLDNGEERARFIVPLQVKTAQV
jgi:hypothetical protein